MQPEGGSVTIDCANPQWPLFGERLRSNLPLEAESVECVSRGDQPSRWVEQQQIGVALPGAIGNRRAADVLDPSIRPSGIRASTNSATRRATSGERGSYGRKTAAGSS